MFLVAINDVDLESPYRRIKVEEIKTTERLIWKEERAEQLLGTETYLCTAGAMAARKAEARLRRLK